MPIATKCPGCKALFRLADDLAGKKMRCQKCGQLFALPASGMPETAAIEPAPPAPSGTAPAENPTPPISLSLDDPLPPAIAEETPAEVVEAILVAPPRPAVIVEATLAADKPEPRDGAKPSKRPDRRRRAADLPRHSTVGAGFLAFFILLGVGGALIAGFVAVWFLLKPTPGGNVAKMPPRKADGLKDVKLGPWDIEHQLALDAAGKGSMAAHTPPHAKAIFHVNLQQNQRYNILVDGMGFQPRVNVFGPNREMVAAQGGQRVLISFRSEGAGDHAIHVANQNNAAVGHFTLAIAREVPCPPVAIVLAAKPSFILANELLLQDEAPAGAGPRHAYLLNAKPGEKYRIKISNAEFKPIVRLQNGPTVRREQIGALKGNLGDLDFTYVAAVPESLSLYVLGEDHGIGLYSLEVTRLSDQPGPRDSGAVPERK